MIELLVFSQFTNHFLNILQLKKHILLHKQQLSEGLTHQAL